MYRYSRRAFFFFVLSVKLGSSCCGLDAPSFPRLKMQLVLIPPSYLITYSFVQTGLFFWGVPLPLSSIRTLLKMPFLRHGPRRLCVSSLVDKQYWHQRDPRGARSSVSIKEAGHSGSATLCWPRIPFFVWEEKGSARLPVVDRDTDSVVDHEWSSPRNSGRLAETRTA